MTLDEAIEYALAEETHWPQAARPATVRPALRVG
jgi:hypothetical protein